jgi:hypothetical protein
VTSANIISYTRHDIAIISYTRHDITIISYTRHDIDIISYTRHDKAVILLKVALNTYQLIFLTNNIISQIIIFNKEKQ